MTMTEAPPYRLACPRCNSGAIRKNLLVEALHLLGIDPVSGEISQGMPVDRRDTPVPPTYVCADCGYENVVVAMFVTTEG